MGDNSGCPGHILTFTECQTNLHTLLCRKCDIVNYPAGFWLSQQCLCPTTHTMLHSHTFHLICFFILKIKPLTPKPPSAPLAWKNPALHPILHLPRGTRSSGPRKTFERAKVHPCKWNAKWKDQSCAICHLILIFLRDIIMNVCLPLPWLNFTIN